MWPYPQFPADLVTFTEEILNGKLHFLYSAYHIKEGKYLFWICMISAKSRGRQLFLVILLTRNDKTLEEPYINKTLEDWLIVSGKRLQLVKIEWTFMWNIHYLLTLLDIFCLKFDFILKKYCTRYSEWWKKNKEKHISICLRWLCLRILFL